MSKNIKVGIAVVAAVAVVAFFFLSNFLSVSNMIPQNPAPAENTNPQGLVIQDEAVGTGDTATAGSTVYVNYVGKLQNGTVFDASMSHNPPAPISFVLGSGQVIPGWDQGLQGMKVGGKRLLIIPPQLAYGSQAMGPIPANSTLVFEVELVKVVSASNTAPLPEGSSAQ